MAIVLFTVAVVVLMVPLLTIGKLAVVVMLKRLATGKALTSLLARDAKRRFFYLSGLCKRDVLPVTTSMTFRLGHVTAVTYNKRDTSRDSSYRRSFTKFNNFLSLRCCLSRKTLICSSCAVLMRSCAVSYAVL
ncbi:hypothetical protein GE09DRAFT_1067035 [Coniochaeta sp. 2T2.1]|nr:hypothetical protein GE09DRAFT_1067035 [Coniochaeta sp. 2T2.1]